MTLCILGQEKTDSNLRLLEEAKKLFGSVFFVPIESVGVGLKNDFTLTYRTSDLLKFGAVMPRIPRHLYSYGYQLLSMFSPGTFMPVPPISFLVASERFFMLTVLRKKGVPTIDMHLARSSIAAVRMLEETEFPVVIRVPTQKTGVEVSSMAEGKSVIEALESLKQPVLIENVVSNLTSVYVAKPDILASVRKVTKEKDLVFAKGEMKKQKLGVEEKHIALETANALGCQVLRVDIAEIKGKPVVADIDLNPELMEAGRVTGVDLPAEIMKRISENYRNHQEKPLLIKFFEDAQSVMKDVMKSNY